MRPKVTILLAVLALALATLACGGGGQSPTKIGQVPEATATVEQEAVASDTTQPSEDEPSPPAPTQPPVPAGGTLYQVGDIVTVGDIVLVVLGWDSPTGGEYNQPDPGDEFVAVDVVLVNQSSRAISMSPMLQMSLKDATAQKYPVSVKANAAAGNSAPSGEINPGERIRGKVGFMVPQSATGLVFVLDASLFSTGKVSVQLGPSPVAVEPPADLAGEQEQMTFAVGDIIEIGDLALTVNGVTYPAGNELWKPEAGHKFVMIDVTLENRGTETKTTSSLLQTYLKDATGQKYTLDLVALAAVGGAPPDSELGPGEKSRGQVGYQVPENATSLVFVFDADLFGQGKVLVALP